MNKDCSKEPSYGVAGSRKREFCTQHAMAGMMNVASKKCGNEGCIKRPSQGVTGSEKREFCAQHAKAGMVNVVNQKFGKEGCMTHVSDAAARARDDHASNAGRTEHGVGSVAGDRENRRNHSIPDSCIGTSGDSSSRNGCVNGRPRGRTAPWISG